MSEQDTIIMNPATGPEAAAAGDPLLAHRFDMLQGEGAQQAFAENGAQGYDEYVDGELGRGPRELPAPEEQEAGAAPMSERRARLRDILTNEAAQQAFAVGGETGYVSHVRSRIDAASTEPSEGVVAVVETPRDGDNPADTAFGRLYDLLYSNSEQEFDTGFEELQRMAQNNPRLLEAYRQYVAERQARDDVDQAHAVSDNVAGSQEAPAADSDELFGLRFTSDGRHEASDDDGTLADDVAGSEEAPAPDSDVAFSVPVEQPLVRGRHRRDPLHRRVLNRVRRAPATAVAEVTNGNWRDRGGNGGVEDDVREEPRSRRFWAGVVGGLVVGAGATLAYFELRGGGGNAHHVLAATAGRPRGTGSNSDLDHFQKLHVGERLHHPDAQTLPTHVNLDGAQEPWDWAAKVYGSNRATPELLKLVHEGQQMRLPVGTRELPGLDPTGHHLFALTYGGRELSTEQIVRRLEAVRLANS